jgi:hypothetical protein
MLAFLESLIIEQGPPMSIESLPKDLLIRIFFELDDHQLSMCSSACSTWMFAVSSDIVWESLMKKKGWPIVEKSLFSSEIETDATKSQRNSSNDDEQVSLKKVYIEHFLADRNLKLNERKRATALGEWARDLWHEYELGLSSCTS